MLVLDTKAVAKLVSCLGHPVLTLLVLFLRSPVLCIHGSSPLQYDGSGKSGLSEPQPRVFLPIRTSGHLGSCRRRLGSGVGVIGSGSLPSVCVCVKGYP